MSRNQLRQLDGSKIRELRHERFLTQQELAQELGVTLRSVQRWEDGSVQPHFAQARRIAAFFDVEPGDLYTPVAA